MNKTLLKQRIFCGIAVLLFSAFLILPASAGLLDTWTRTDTASFGWLENVSYGDGQFVAVGDNGMLVVSTDGKNWRRKITGVAEDFSGIVYGNGSWVAVTWEGSIYLSADTDTWILQKAAESGKWLSGAAYGNGVFVASGATIFASGDGVSWQEKTTATYNYSGITYADNKFVVVGAEIQTSVDGSTWISSLPTASISDHISGIAYGNGKFVATDAKGKVYTSPDTNTWTSSSSGVSEWLDKVAFGNGMFVTVGQKGGVLTSIDGVTWTPKSYGTGGRLNGIAFGADTFTAVGVDLILDSQAAPISVGPHLSVSPTSYEFGSLIAGNTADKTLTILNSGSTPLNIGNLNISGDDAIQFSLHDDHCSNLSLATFATCTVGVLFTQTTEGIKNGAVNVPSDDPVTPLAAVSLRATNQYDLTVTSSGGGSLSTNISGVSCGYDSCAGKVAYGTTVTINATSGIFDTFTEWSGACTGSGPCTFTMTANAAITATFGEKSFSVVASAGANGSISPSGTEVSTGCYDRTYSITPDPGYIIADVKVDGLSLGAQQDSYDFTCNASQCSYRFSCIQDNHTISADFAVNSGNTYTISATTSEEGNISPAGSVTVNKGATQTFKLYPDYSSSSNIVDVKVDNISVGPLTSYTFPNVTADHTIEVISSPRLAKLTYGVTGPGTISFSPPGTSCGENCLLFGEDEKVTLSASHGVGVSFEGWGTNPTYVSANCTGTGDCSLYLYNDTTVTANFVGCTYSLSADSQEFGTAGGSGEARVTTNGRECSWGVQNNAPSWLTVLPAINYGMWSGEKVSLYVSPDGDKITKTKNTLTNDTEASLIIKMPVSGCGASSVTQSILSDVPITNDGTFTYNDSTTQISGKFDSQFGVSGTYTYSRQVTQCSQSPSIWNPGISIYHPGTSIYHPGTCTYYPVTYCSPGYYTTTPGYYTTTPGYWTPGVWLTGTISGSGTWTASSISKSGEVHYTVAPSSTPTTGSLTIAEKTFIVTIPDYTPPTIVSFTLPATFASLTVPISSLTATDNFIVSGYLVTDSDTPPLAADNSWSDSAPTSFIFTSRGTKTLYVWTKDSVGNISLPAQATTTILPQYTINANVTGRGSISMPSKSIDCGLVCSTLVDDGTSAILTAVPAEAWSFVGWSGACSGTGVCALSVHEDQTVIANFERRIYDDGTWIVSLAGDSGPSASPVDVSVGGIYFDSASELKISRLVSPGSWPQLFSIKGNGYLRSIPPGGEWGTSFVSTGLWRDGTTSPVHRLKVEGLDLGVVDNRLVLRGTAVDDLVDPGVAAPDFTISLEPPTANRTEGEVSYTLKAVKPLALDALRQENHEGFRIAQFSSMYIDSTRHDADNAVYMDSSGFREQAELSNHNAFIFPTPATLGGDGILQLLHTDSQPRNTPTQSIRVIEPPPSACTPQGWVKYTGDSNDDNVGGWINWDGASASVAAGGTIGTFRYRLSAIAPQTPVVAGPGAVSCGAVEIGSSSVKNVRVANHGSFDLTINALSLSGDSEQNYLLSNDTCAGATLAPLAECTTEITFEPDSIGNKNAKLVVLSSDPIAPSYEIRVYAAGVDAPDLSAPGVTVFDIPSTSATLIVPVVFTATDNIGVSDYLLTESAAPPLLTANGWSVAAPTQYTFLSSGTKTLYAWARDVTGNVSSLRSDTVVITIPATSITVTPGLVSPQVTGTAITITGLAKGGDAGPYEYRFWYRNAATATYTLGRDYAPSTSWSWNTATLALPAGGYVIAVEARHVGSTAVREARLAVNYKLTSPATSITVTPNLVSPQAIGTAITFTGLAGGGDAGPYEYRFWYRNAAAATYTLGRDYSASASWSWNTATLALPAGSYVVAVEARHAGSIAVREARLAVNYKLISPATSITVTKSLASPQGLGTAITFTGLAGGGDSGPYEYRFWYRSATTATYTLGRDYSASAAWSWNTATLALPAGSYVVAVETRHLGSKVVREARLAVTYTLNSASPATSITVTKSVASPQKAGTAITFTGLAGGGDSGPYEYRFWYRNAAAATYTLGRDYGASAAWSWNTATLALPAGNYVVAVETRHLGSIAVREARLAVTYSLFP